jgi:hypothetical protein
MRHQLVLVVMLIAAAVPAPGYCQTSPGVSDFTGTWSVRWLSNDSRNPMSVVQRGTELTGNYRDDAGDQCTVFGNFAPQPRRVALQISCPKWAIKMDGFASVDGKIVAGHYTAYGNSVGGFLMSRE